MNVVMTSAGKFIELQGTAEGAAFGDRELTKMIELAKGGMKLLDELQQKACQEAVEKWK
jgi:ribonuclease PH